MRQIEVYDPNRVRYFKEVPITLYHMEEDEFPSNNNNNAALTNNKFVNQMYTQRSGTTSERQLPAIPRRNSERVDIPDTSGSKSQAGHRSRNDSNASNAVKNKVVIDLNTVLRLQSLCDYISHDWHNLYDKTNLAQLK